MENSISIQGFVTQIVTRNMSVTITHNFYLRPNEDRFGFCRVYLHASQNNRARLSLDVLGKRKFWDKKKQRFKPVDDHHINQNAVLDVIYNRITNIVLNYRLQERLLTLNQFVEEFGNAVPRIDFISFFDYALKNKTKNTVSEGTYRRHKVVLTKLKEFKKEVLFHQIDEDFIKELKAFLAKKNNVNTTINSNLSVIKKYIKLAEKYQIQMPISFRDISIGSTNGNRVNLKAEEVQKLRKFYFSEWINPSQRLVLGYFLFSCFTGARLGDVLHTKRKDLMGESFSFVPRKTLHYKNKVLSIKISPRLREIIEHEEQLFVTHFTGEHINRELKLIAKFLGIHKKISMHVGRHTFATNYLRAGGTVEKLQRLLGHSKITQSMDYVHVVENEAQEEVLMLDSLF